MFGFPIYQAHTEKLLQCKIAARNLKDLGSSPVPAVFEAEDRHVTQLSILADFFLLGQVDCVDVHISNSSPGHAASFLHLLT